MYSSRLFRVTYIKCERRARWGHRGLFFWWTNNLKLRRLISRALPITTLMKQGGSAGVGSGTGRLAAAPTQLALRLTANFDDGFNTPAPDRARSCPSNPGCVHSSFKHRKRHLRHSTGSSCLWVRQRPTHYDPGASPSTVQRRTSDTRLSRILWPTIRISSTSAGPAATCAKYSTGD